MERSQVIADGNRMAGSFKPLITPEAKPAIIVVSGLPGTGKTYFCRHLAEYLPFVIVESDALRKQLFPTPAYSASESASLFRAIHSLIEDLLKKGTSVILDATNLEERHRERIYRIAESTNARLVLVQVEAPAELVRQRLKSRAKKAEGNSDADWTIYQKMKTTAEKIKRGHFTVDTSRDISPIIEKIVREVKH
jgi:predicted kinase